MQLTGEPITASYSVRDGEDREGKKSGGYEGKYLITSLELDGQTNDDSKYSVKLESHGPHCRSMAASPAATRLRRQISNLNR